MSDDDSGRAALIAPGNASIGGDFVGRDKITHITNVYTLDAPAQAGLEALTDLIRRSSEARDAALGFRADFLSAHQQLDLLGDYKLLHDILHRLQYQCANGLAQAALRFPGDDLAAEQLSEYQFTLESLIADAQNVAARASVPRIDTAWLEDLLTARQELSAALETLDSAPLKKAIWRLNRVLTKSPSRINSLLNQAARLLRLPALISALDKLCAYLTTLKLDAEKVDQFYIGVDALSVLELSLTALVEAHDRWQEVDDELRRIEALLEADLAELEMSWPDLKRKAEPLCAGAEDWAASLRKDEAGLNESLTGANPAKARLAFRKFRRRAGERFYRVDVNLKEMCEKLRLIGAPLATVTGLIQ